MWLYTRPSRFKKYVRAAAAAAADGSPAWVLVTGASDVIGKAVCFELATQGFNVVLHGRNPAKLERSRDELSPARSFRILILDAFECHNTDAVDLDGIVREAVDDIRLTVVINCAGAGPRPTFTPLAHYGRQDILDTIHLNAAFPAPVARAVIPILLCNSLSPVLLLNIASVSDVGLPLISFYGAPKAIGHVLGLSVWNEMKTDHHDSRRDIMVVSHRVGAVTAPSHERREPSFFTPPLTPWPGPCSRAPGAAVRSSSSISRNALQQLVLAVLPTPLADWIMIEAMREWRTEQDDAAVGKEARVMGNNTWW
ncbi:hypothetical protein DL769_001769 [Monosporascus sp. CRB-8-3]|nr:hypothetical protein DL769_001769 [Monosporascus sp. CRB-8-3]